MVILAMGLLGFLPGCDDDGPSAARVTTGSLSIDVVGLPADADALVEVTDPQGTIHPVRGDTTLTALTPGTYAVTAHPNAIGAFAYDAETATQYAEVEAARTSLVRVAYLGRAAFGELVVAIEGLPDGVAASVQVDGPDGFSQSITATDTLRGLVAGTYALTAVAIEHSGSTFHPTPVSEVVTVSAGAQAGAFFTFSGLDPDAVDLRVIGLEMIQAVQRADGSVPLIRDRDALLRIHATASQPFSPAPEIRVEFTVNGDLVWTQNVPPGATAMPTSIDRSDLTRSWNLTVPGSLVQPGLQVRATIDPSGAVLESDETNNRYPADGSRFDFDVVTMGPLPLRLVPVATTASGLTGNVNAGNAAAFVGTAAEIFPFERLDAQVRSTFTSDAPVLQATNGNGAWYDVLRDVLNLRTADGGSAFYYYGVVQVDYSSGVAGMGFVSFSRSGGPNTAIGWDRSGSRDGVLAHELGHNLGRSHAPCGGPVDTDPGYPYANARTGQWGYDPRVQRLLDPAAVYDIMSYCRPQWISDYNWEKIRVFAAPSLARSPSTEQNCVLVSGRIESGLLVLDPMVQLVTVPRVPLARGEYEIRATDATGRELLAVSFAPETIGCAEGDEVAVFSWALPVNTSTASAIETVVLEGRGLSTARFARSEPVTDSSETPFHVRRVDPEHVRLEWDAQRHPLVVVRDAERAETVALARRGALTFPTHAQRLELVLSDGARSTTRIVDLD